MAQRKIILTNAEPQLSHDSDALAQIITDRMGLSPRKKGSTLKMHAVLIEFYERAKKATATKDQKRSVMTVEEMAQYANISRQTMYEYLERWLDLELITKVTYMDERQKLVVGYKLQGSSIEDAFGKTISAVQKNLDHTKKLIAELQKQIKNEKISDKMKQQKRVEDYVND